MKPEMITVFAVTDTGNRAHEHRPQYYPCTAEALEEICMDIQTEADDAGLFDYDNPPTGRTWSIHVMRMQKSDFEASQIDSNPHGNYRDAKGVLKGLLDDSLTEDNP